MDPINAEPLPSEDVPLPEATRQLAPPLPERRPSHAWAAVRAALVLLLALAMQGVAVVGIMILTDVIGPLGGKIKPEEVGRHVGVLFAAYIPSVVVILLAWRFLDRGTLAQIGHPGPPTRILRGLGLGTLGGIAFMGVIVGLGILAGGYRIEFGSADGMLGWLGWTPFLMLAAYFEELLLRGYVMQNLGRRWPLVGLVLSSLVFTLLHLANPNTDHGPDFTIILTVEIAVAGLFLGALYLLCGDLWLVTGVHFGWNWAQGVLFGLPVSGMSVPSIGQGELLETNLVTGSGFGPESSLIALALTTLAAAACIGLVIRRGAILPLEAHRVQPAVGPEEAVPSPPPLEVP